MNQVRVRFSSAVTTLLALTAIALPGPARALQLYSHVGRPSSNAVANHGDSLPTPAPSGGSSASDSDATAPATNLYSPSGERGSGLSGKVFARFVMPEDWIALASAPGASVASASVQGGPTSHFIVSAQLISTGRLRQLANPPKGGDAKPRD